MELHLSCTKPLIYMMFFSYADIVLAAQNIGGYAWHLNSKKTFHTLPPRSSYGSCWVKLIISILTSGLCDLTIEKHISIPQYDWDLQYNWDYCQISNIRCTLVGNEIVDHSDVVGASSFGAAPTTSSFSTQHLASIDCSETTARQDEKHLHFGIWWPYIKDLMVIMLSRPVFLSGSKWQSYCQCTSRLSLPVAQ